MWTVTGALASLVFRRAGAREDAVGHVGTEQPDAGDTGDFMALVGQGVGNLIDHRHHQHADEAAPRIALLLGTAGAGTAFPQQLAGAQIHQAGAGGDNRLAGDDQIAGAVVLDVEVQRGIGTVDGGFFPVKVSEKVSIPMLASIWFP